MRDAGEHRDIELMRRLCSGDEDAFLEFYRRHQGAMYRFALHMTGRPDSAADIVQETFLTLIRQAAKFDEQRGHPAAFLFGIARNHLRKLQEKEGRYVAFSADMEGALRSGSNGSTGGLVGNGSKRPTADDRETVLDGIEREELAGLLRRAVLTLPEHYRMPVTLCDLEGKSYEEVATLLECPVGTVRSRLNRARSMLLEKLRPARARAGTPERRSGGEGESDDVR